MYQALYRKWRPLTFDQVIGQEHITRILCNQVADSKLSHAYLFIGSRGTGKTTCARILARAVNCEHPVNGNPCGKCPACKEILSGSAPELVEIDAASNNGVDDVRALRDEAIFSPTTLKKRVYIIDEVHMLSKPAFNALLKILEEPPEHLLFILATTELNKVPATILSRCQRFSFKRIQQADISEHLKRIASEESISLSEDAADMIARLAEGGMRDALSLLDQCSSAETVDAEYVKSALGLSGNTNICSLLDSISSGNSEGAINLFNSLWNDGKDPGSVLKELDSLLRDIVLFSTCGKSAEGLLSGSFNISEIKHFSSVFSSRRLLEMMECIQKHLTDMRDNSSPKLVAEVCLLTLCNNNTEPDDLESRIANLEKIITTGSEFRIQEHIQEGIYPDKEAECRFVLNKEKSDAGYETEREDQAAKSDAETVDEKENFVAPENVDAGCSWSSVAELIRPALPREISSFLSGNTDICGRIDDNVVTISAKQGFLFNRLNSSDVISKISAIMRNHYGREFRVIVSEMSQQGTACRDINELKKHSVVKFE